MAAEENSGLIDPTRGFEQEPRATLGFIDPNFDETCGRNITMFRHTRRGPHKTRG
jgi:hypothetical protein